jgi:5-methylcytosine-specific restriction endonuclease McrA
MRTLRNGRKRWQLFMKYNGRCAICGELLGGDFQVDHRIPYKVTGCTDLVNLQPVHPACNRRKGSKDDSFYHN